jgi:hypothetical protein
MFVIISVVVLAINEVTSIQEYASLREGLSIVYSLPDTNTIDTSRNGELVHVSGLAAAPSQLNGTLFGVQADALKFKRTVEMYQTIEHINKNTQRYGNDWVNKGVDSSKYKSVNKRVNPPFPPYRKYEKVADPITFGAFTLDDSDVISKIDWYENITTIVSVGDIPDPSSITDTDRTIMVLPGNRGYFIGGVGRTYEVGDIRVGFEIIPYQNISIVGRQSDSGLSNFVTSNGGDILLVEPGLVSAEDMFEHAEEDEFARYFTLLFFMSILLCVGAAMVVNAFSEFRVVLFFFGDFAAVTGAMRFTVPFILAGAIATVVIAISWLASQHRLPVAIPLLCGGLGLFYLVRYYMLWGAKHAAAQLGGDDIKGAPRDLETNGPITFGSAESNNGPVACTSAVAVHHA